MGTDILVNKAASIERCVNRAQEEYQKDPATFTQDHTRQDAAILNIQRACEAALDMGQHVIQTHGLGVAQSSRDIFQILADSGRIPQSLSDQLQNMVGFRNIAVHEYQKLQLPIVEAIINRHLDEFAEFSRLLLKTTTRR